MYRQGSHDGTESIGSQQTRVVIIATDMNNDATYVGEYGQTLPFAPHDFGADVVAVEFRTTLGVHGSTNFNHVGYFPLFSLCRALNEDVPGAPSTIF